MASPHYFNYTRPTEVFNENHLLPGTAVHYKAGSPANGNFVEGNGIVVMCSPLLLEIELYELHRGEFIRITLPINDFVSGSIVMQVLTVEDGTGSEPTGATPTDIYPPSEVSGLYVEYDYSQNTFYWSNPTTDFHHVKILRDGMLIADNVTAEFYTEIGLLAEGVSYTYTFITVDANGNQSLGVDITFTMATQSSSPTTYVVYA